MKLIQIETLINHCLYTQSFYGNKVSIGIEFEDDTLDKIYIKMIDKLNYKTVQHLFDFRDVPKDIQSITTYINSNFIQMKKELFDMNI